MGCIAGSLTSSDLDQVYCLEGVSVISGSDGGGLVGTYCVSDGSPHSVSNSYSRANVSMLDSGGLFGNLRSSGTPFTISSTYASNYVKGTSNTGKITALISFSAVILQVSDVFFNNQTTNASAIGCIESSPSTISSPFQGVTCSDLFSAVSSFNQSIWSGDRLKIEYNFTPGVCSCPDCPTQSPSA